MGLLYDCVNKHLDILAYFVIMYINFAKKL